jgi:hypothetical protein
MRTVFIYVNTSKQVAEADHLKVFANHDLVEIGSGNLQKLG